MQNSQGALDAGVASASDEAKALATRWRTVGEAFTIGNPELADGLRRLYADRENWPTNAASEAMRANMPSPEHMTFIAAVSKPA